MRVQRRITQIFTNLFAKNQDQEEGDGSGSGSSSQSDRASAGQLATLREQTEEQYKNLSWTRVIALEYHRPEDRYSWPIASDLADEFDVLFTINEDILPELAP